MKGIYLEYLSWPEAERVLRRRPLVVLPLGARTKEHGFHLPLNNDWLIAEYLTRRVVELCPVVALPTLQYGFYPAFTEYPGSVSLRQDVCRDVVIDICDAMARHGAGFFYVLNTGISTVRSLAPARDKLAALGIDLEYTDIVEAYGEVRRRVQTQEAGSHADEIETSMMLYIAPDVVRLDKAVCDINEDRGPGGLTRDPHKNQGVYSPSGAFGDPTLATLEKGEIVVESMVTHLVARLRELIEQRDLARSLEDGD